MNVALISLLPLDVTGGGELYTLETAQAIAASGDDVILAAPVRVPPAQTNLTTRLSTPFVWTDLRSDGSPDVIEWSELLTRLADRDRVWVHQYLATDLVFDVIASTASDQDLLLTSLGFEPLRAVFTDLYQPCHRHHVVEISAYAARRAGAYARHASWAHAAIWRSDLGVIDDCDRRGHEYLALGRVLPHKGLETTIDALEPDEVLHIVGPAPDDAYASFLRERGRDKHVQFHGCLPRADVRQLIKQTTGLISASTHQLFDGRLIEQPELLGLVLCEALRDGTLPVASDVPAYREVMGSVGLTDWTFHEGDTQGLRGCLSRLAALPANGRRERITAARESLAAKFAWDDYWPRVCARIEDTSRCA
ncbi:MAG: glycosyltransferase [Vicinamibacterales bacterium]